MRFGEVPDEAWHLGVLLGWVSVLESSLSEEDWSVQPPVPGPFVPGMATPIPDTTPKAIQWVEIGLPKHAKDDDLAITEYIQQAAPSSGSVEIAFQDAMYLCERWADESARNTSHLMGAIS